jgi:RNA polymerase sigma-54 factor
MRMEVSHQLRPEQTQILSPKMIQSMEILQLPMMALQERINQELDKNPVLEQVEAGDDDGREPDKPEVAPAQTLRERQAEKDKTEPGFERIEAVSDDFGDYFNRSSYANRRASGERDRKMDAMANTAARDIGLQDYLQEQLGFLDAPPRVRKLAEAVVEHLEDSGYLRAQPDDIKKTAEMPDASPEEVEAAVRLVQRCEPAGVGARGLPECMLLQLERLDGDHTVARELIGKHLDDLVNNRLPAICRKTGFTVHQIEEAVKFLRTLQPRPGAVVGSAPVPYVTPDVIIEYDEDRDDYTIRLADDNYPNLCISDTYRRMLRNGIDSKAKEFIQNNIRSAHWLINSIEQRRNTLMRVANKVVEHQKEYLARGSSALKPLPMTQVAAELGIHVGTVSRAVSEKYAQTPRGILSLRSFFTGGTQNAEGEDIAWDAVRAKLVDIIKAEDKTEPLSDGDIVKKLKDLGIEVARRTVAKYRKILRIPSARRRRQFTDETVAAMAAPKTGHGHGHGPKEKAEKPAKASVPVFTTDVVGPAAPPPPPAPKAPVQVFTTPVFTSNRTTPAPAAPPPAPSLGTPSLGTPSLGTPPSAPPRLFTLQIEAGPTPPSPAPAEPAEPVLR